MARLQILELPVEHHGDDMVTPWILVIDQASDEVEASVNAPDGCLREGLAEEIRSRGILVFRETVDIPANENTALPEPLPRVAEPASANDAERAGITQIVYAHERTRLDLCSALLLDSGTTWRKLIELAAERQRELAGLYKERDAIDPELAALVLETLGIEMTASGARLDEVLHKACRELQHSEAARAHLRRERKEARMWARHGYEIGQKHCGWTDHGVAPDWLTEGWPRAFDSCEHLKQAAQFDEALSRVRALAERWRYTGDRKGSPLSELLSALDGVEPPTPEAP